jgi:hypothetical protein
MQSTSVIATETEEMPHFMSGILEGVDNTNASGEKSYAYSIIRTRLIFGHILRSLALWA